MKRSITLVLVMLLMLVVGAAGAPPAYAYTQHKVTGHVEFPLFEWAPGLRIWFYFDVREVSPRNHEAAGAVNWAIYNPAETPVWRYVSSTPVCAAFKDSSAVMVVKLREVRGWGAGEPGQFARFWVRDGGKAGPHTDQWGLQSYNEAEFIEFWPADQPPDCTSKFDFDWPTPVDIERGDLAIS